jgi:hypothetical protein
MSAWVVQIAERSSACGLCDAKIYGGYDEVVVIDGALLSRARPWCHYAHASCAALDGAVQR